MEYQFLNFCRFKPVGAIIVIGVLLNARQFKKMISGQETLEKLQFYQHFSQQYQVPICFYSIQNATINQPDITGYVIDPAVNKTSLKKVLWPKYHFCRAILSQKNRDTIEELIVENYLQFYQLQSQEERNKETHIQFLRSNRKLTGHIPDTMPLNKHSLQEMLRKHEQILLKPVTGSLGKKIVLVEKKCNHYLLYSKNGLLANPKIFSLGELIEYISKRYLQQSKYLVQERVKVDTFKNRIYECRTSVQLNETGEWEVTGKVIRLAQPNKFLTNIHQGAEAMPFQTLFTDEMPVVRAINNLSIMIAEELAKHLNIIDFGLDLMLDYKQHIWFIESNLRDQRLSYKAANDYQTWYRTTTTPLSYILSRMKEDQCNRSFLNFSDFFPKQWLFF
ncbi:MAG: YheC/YheD family protein [Bacillota bacterium]